MATIELKEHSKVLCLRTYYLLELKTGKKSEFGDYTIDKKVMRKYEEEIEMVVVLDYRKKCLKRITPISQIESEYWLKKGWSEKDISGLGCFSTSPVCFYKKKNVFRASYGTTTIGNNTYTDSVVVLKDITNEGRKIGIELNMFN